MIRNPRYLRAGLLGAFLLLLTLNFPSVLPAQESPSRGVASEGAATPHAELAKESREAAGEEKDETAEFKESASVRMLAKWTGLKLGQAYWLSVVLNFAVIAGAVLWFSRSKLPGIFRARTESIQKAMEEARRASEEARARLSQVEARLAKLGDEVAEMGAAADRDAVAEEARLKAAAEEDGRKIVESAEQEIAAAAKTARRELTAYAAELAVSLAKKQIRVDPATDQSLVRNFAGQLSGNGGKERG